MRCPLLTYSMAYALSATDIAYGGTSVEGPGHACDECMPGAICKVPFLSAFPNSPICLPNSPTFLPNSSTFLPNSPPLPIELRYLSIELRYLPTRGLNLRYQPTADAGHVGQGGQTTPYPAAGHWGDRTCKQVGLPPYMLAMPSFMAATPAFMAAILVYMAAMLVSMAAAMLACVAAVMLVLMVATLGQHTLVFTADVLTTAVLTHTGCKLTLSEAILSSTCIFWLRGGQLGGTKDCPAWDLFQVRQPPCTRSGALYAILVPCIAITPYPYLSAPQHIPPTLSRDPSLLCLSTP